MTIRLKSELQRLGHVIWLFIGKHQAPIVGQRVIFACSMSKL
jgi:sorbitol-specific phosphotransferase system component IIA